MTFLPIVERELRTAARKASGHWVRALAALAATGGCGWALLTSMRYVSTAQQGQLAFAWLAWLAFLYALTAGPRTTADSLSQEKREGTLGLLFLTDLKGHDVVLGKLAATSLHTFYGLLAMLPVLAIPILMGGVTAAVFWKTVLALVNMLLVSLAAGLFVSSISRVDRKAAGATLVLVLAMTGGPPLVEAIITEANVLPWAADVARLSPGYAFVLGLSGGGQVRPGAFWWSLVFGVGSTCLLLALASRFARRVWQDKPPSRRGWRWGERWRNWIYGSPAARAALRRRLLDINPVLWLSSRLRFVPFYPWVLLGAMTLIWLYGYGQAQEMMLSSGTMVLCYLTNAVFKYWIATVAAQAFAADRDQGALELLLSTPLRVEELIRGQWLALRRLFAVPLAATAVLELGLVGVGIGQLRSMGDLASWVALMLAMVVVLAADVWAVAWMGQWLGIRLKKANKAVSTTVNRVLLLPWLTAVIVLLASGRDMSPNAFWVVLVVVSLVVDPLAAWYARDRLRRHLRRAATERHAAALPTFLGLPVRG